MRRTVLITLVITASLLALAGPASAAARTHYVGIYSTIAGWCAGAPSGGGTVTSVECNKHIRFTATRWTRRGATLVTRRGALCLAASSGTAVTRPCTGRRDQAWAWNGTDRELENKASGLCLTLPGEPGPLVLAACVPYLQPAAFYQLWNLLRPQAA